MPTTWDVRRMAKRVRRILPAIRRHYRGQYEIGPVVIPNAGPPRVAIPVKKGDAPFTVIEYRELLQPVEIAERFGAAMALAKQQ